MSSRARAASAAATSWSVTAPAPGRLASARRTCAGSWYICPTFGVVAGLAAERAGPGRDRSGPGEWWARPGGWCCCAAGVVGSRSACFPVAAAGLARSLAGLVFHGARRRGAARAGCAALPARGGLADLAAAGVPVAGIGGVEQFGRVEQAECPGVVGGGGERVVGG